MLTPGSKLLGLSLSLVALLAIGAAPPIVLQSNPCATGTSVVASPSPGQVGNQLSGVVSLSASNAWAVGSASTPVGTPLRLRAKPLVIHWDGAAWRLVHSAPLVGPGALNAISAVSPNDIWVVGHQGPPTGGTPLIEHWNGSAWSVVASPVIPEGFLLGVSSIRADDVWAVGIRDVITGQAHSLIEHWDGSTWKVVKSPNPSATYNELDSVVWVSPKDAWAVGQSLSGIASVPLLARWNGTGWHLVPGRTSGLPNNLLRSVAARSGHDIWAVGQSSSEDGSKVQPLAEHWNGKRWTIAIAAAPASQSWLTGVSVAGDQVSAVGARVINFTNRTLIERFEDGQFDVVASRNRGGLDNALVSVAVNANGTAWAVGSDNGKTRGQSLVLLVCPDRNR
jgi:hypothetical protein